MKKIYTLALTLLAMGTAATSAQADDFTPVSSLSAGWYQMRLVASAQKSTVSTDAPLYVTSTETEYTQKTGSYYPFKLVSDATSESQPASRFVYIGTSGSNYTFKSSDGHYGNANAISATSATALAVTSSSLATDAFQVGGAWDAYGDYVGKYSGSDLKAAFQFATADVSGYDIWTVKIILAPTATNLINYPMVSTSNAESKGLSKVYDGGNFFFTKGTELSESDFALANFDGYKTHVTFDTDNKIIRVWCSYQNESLKEGGVYTITNVQNSGTKYLFGTTDDNTLSLSSDTTTDGSQYFVCHKEDNGQYVFVNVKTGKYLTYKNSSNDNVDGLSETCDSKQKFSLTSANSTLAGSFLLSTDVREGRTDEAGTFVVMKAGTFDSWSSSKVGYVDAYSTLFTFEEVTDFTYNTVNLQTKDGKAYATLYLPYAYNLPDGVDAYYATAVNEGDATTLTMKKIDGTAVPKATAVLLCASDAGSHTVSAATTQPTAVEGNKLAGTLSDEAAETGKTAYAFSGKFDKIGFYKYTGTNLPKGKAYLLLDSTTGEGDANCLTLNFGDKVTGISNAAADAAAPKAVFDLSGRKVSKPAHGLYIVNGKKVIL